MRDCKRQKEQASIRTAAVDSGARADRLVEKTGRR
jgi:hypothetical protein